MPKAVTILERKRIAGLIRHYRENHELVARFAEQVLVALRESEALSEEIHSIRSRLKAPAHLRDKLMRKQAIAKGATAAFDITPANLFARITDLAGIRILHLHTRQFTAINRILKQLFREQQYRLLEGPFARTWDDESRAYFKSLDVETQDSPTLYTSVHYVIESASLTKVTCEVQVRTLMEEVWGEVDHAVNYPHPVKSIACREQIAALARGTSSTTRLVDAIFATVADLRRRKKRRR